MSRVPQGYQPTPRRCIHLQGKACNMMGGKCVEKKFFFGVDPGACERRVVIKPKPPNAKVVCCGKRAVCGVVCGGDL
jgi:hypothetical protein